MNVKDNILAEGETTGHFHQAVGEGVYVKEENNTRTLSAPNGAQILHQEHNRITIPPGEYEQLIVQEYDPFEEQIKNVID